MTANFLKDFGKEGLLLILLSSLKCNVYTGTDILTWKCEDRGGYNNCLVIP